MNRRLKPPPPVKLTGWVLITILFFIGLIEYTTIGYQAGVQKTEREAERAAISYVESFKQTQITSLADLMQGRNPKLYRAKAEQYARLIIQECNRQGIEYLQLVAQIVHESGLNEFSTGAVGEIGLMQICPWWLTKADVLGLEPISETELYDPVNNIRWGVAILARCLRNTHGDLYKALCFYNAGPKWERGKRYAEKVLRLRSMLEILSAELIG